MKITFISRTYWPKTHGGAELHFYELRKRLGGNITVYTWDNIKDRDIKVIKIPKIKLLGSLLFSVKAAREINKSDADLVLINQYWSEYSCFFLRIGKFYPNVEKCFLIFSLISAFFWV